MKKFTRLTIICLMSVLLSGCLSMGAFSFFGSEDTYNDLLDLRDIGDPHGTIVVGYVNKWDDPVIRQPDVPNPINATDEGRASGVFNLKDFYAADPTDPNGWVPPEIELGAIYYIPKKYDKGDEPTVVQKLCRIEKNHDLGNIPIIDTKGTQTFSSSSRKLVVSGTVAKGLVRSVFPVAFGVSVNGTYLVEVEVKNIRRRYIRSNLAKIVFDRVSGGPKCSEELMPPRSSNKKLMLEQIEYADIIIKRVAEADLDINGAVVGIKGGYSTINRDGYFLAFKWLK